MKKLFGKLKGLDYRHYIFATFLCVLFLFVGLEATRIFPRIWLSLRVFASNIGYYFTAMVDRSKAVVPEQVYDLIGQGSAVVLPGDYSTFATDFNVYWKVVFNFENMSWQFNTNTNNLYYFLQFLNIGLMIYALVTLLAINYYEPKFMKKGKKQVERPVGYETKSLQRYKKFEDMVILPVYRWCVGMINFFLGHKAYVWLSILAIALYSNAFAVAIDLIGWYFLFIASIDFLSIYKTIVMLLTDLYPFLSKIPTLIYLLLAWRLFDYICDKIGFDFLERVIAYVIGFLKNAGIIALNIGRMKKGKSQQAVYNTLLLERFFRDQCLEVMLEVSLLFPNFPFRTLEREIQKKMSLPQGAEGRLFNRRLVALYIKSNEDAFKKKPSKKFIWGYDFKRYPLETCNALTVESIFHALSDYAQVFFMYNMSCPLAAGNLPVRFDGVKVDYGHFPFWDYDWLHRDPHDADAISRRIKNLNQDSIRLGKKMDPATKYAFVLDGCVVLQDEVGKERPNQLETADIKKSDDSTNVKNDRFNDALKMIRSRATVRHRLFIAFAMTEQRDDSVPADLRELCDVIVDLNDNQNQMKIARPLFMVRPTFIQWLVSVRDRKWVMFNSVRDDSTLPGYLFGNLVSKLSNWLSIKFNTFGYEQYNLKCYDGSMNEKTMYLQKYYLPYKVARADRYVSDTHKQFYNQGFEEAELGFMDLPEFTGSSASPEEFEFQHSYFMTDLLKMAAMIKQKPDEVSVPDVPDVS